MIRCATCTPPGPAGVRLGEYHVGVQFGDILRGTWTITLDGTDITNQCTEAQAVATGPGWAVVIVDPLVICSDDHALTELRFGDVAIAVRPRLTQPTP